jgi:hypothetical protein
MKIYEAFLRCDIDKKLRLCREDRGHWEVLAPSSGRIERDSWREVPERCLKGLEFLKDVSGPSKK